MTAPTSVALSKLLLLACDQAYYNAPYAKGTALGYLSDNTSTDPAYANPAIYTDKPSFNDEGFN